MSEELIFARWCGGCTECCRTLAVPEVGHQGGGEWCPKCKVGQGCSIYNSRPTACRLYACVWLAGKLEEKERPDKLKVVISPSGCEFQGREFTILNIWEVEDGAINRARVEQIMVANINAGNIVAHHLLISSCDRRYYFPKGMFSLDEQEDFIHFAENG